MPSDSIQATTPWWRHPMVWLVVAGPAIVVLAGFATWALAARGSDQPVSAESRTGSLAPATQARNHAATAHR